MVMTGKIHRVVIGGVDMTEYVVVKTPSCGPTYGPSPIYEALQALFNPRTGIEVCDVCGCAHRSHLGHLCNSCYEGIRGVEHAQLMERFKAACEKLGKAFAHTGVAFMGASDAMHVERVRDDYFMVSMKCPGGTVSTVDNIMQGLAVLRQTHEPPDFASFTESFASTVASRYGMSVADLLRGSAFYHPPALPRPKRDRKNRGPAKHSEWWNKGKRW